MNKSRIIASILIIFIIFVVFSFVSFFIKSVNNATPEVKIIKPTEDISTKIAENVIKPIENSVNPVSNFGEQIVFRVNDKITFSDGLNVTLKEINDSRCPKGVQCIWAGEIAGTFMISGAKLIAPKEIRLGMIRNKSVVMEGYTFSLKDATTTSMILEVIKN